MKKVIIGKSEYTLEDKDAALIEAIKELTKELKASRIQNGR